MKIRLLVLTLAIIFAASCKNHLSSQTATKVNADSIINNIDKYYNKKVEVEGAASHICGIDGKKMKLTTKNGKIIKIISCNPNYRFSKTYNRREVRIIGTVLECRIDKALIDKYEKDGTLLCSIDNSACKDSNWIKSNTELGIAKKLSQRSIKRLRSMMESTGKDYVATVVIKADSIQIID